MKARLWAIATVALVAVGACEVEPMGTTDCGALLDRIVALEVKRAGFDDAKLTRRWQETFRRTLVAELAHCAERQRDEENLECVSGARSAEILVECLR